MITDVLISKIKNESESYINDLAEKENGLVWEDVDDKAHHDLIRKITAFGELFPTAAKECLELIGNVERAYAAHKEWFADYNKYMEEMAAQADNERYALDVAIESTLHHYL